MNVIGVDDLTVTVGVIVIVAGMLVTLWQAIKAVREMTQPAKDLVSRVDRIEEHLASDKERLDEQEEAQKLLLRGMLMLAEHEITGNHTSDFALLKSDISNYLINR
jgi:uncharacterized membrane-anchored protein